MIRNIKPMELEEMKAISVEDTTRLYCLEQMLLSIFLSSYQSKTVYLI